jgi:endonuclease III
MQLRFQFKQAEDLLKIRDCLLVEFGNFRTSDRAYPLSQFVLCFISSRTHDHISLAACQNLLGRYPNPLDLADVPVSDIHSILEHVTFSEKKARELKEALQIIRLCWDRIGPAFGNELSVEEALRRLETIHGVGRKIAAATLNFSNLRSRAFVVDTAVLRFSKRFGLVGKTATTARAYTAIMSAAGGFDADDLFEMHWLIKHLSKRVCSHDDPYCGHCPLSEMCLKRINMNSLAN